MTFIVSGSDGGTFPSWTTATRPASPAVGQMGYNTTTGQFDQYTSFGWASISGATTPQVTTYTSSSGTYTTPTGAKYLQVEMIGGGSGGGGGGNSGTTGASSTAGNTTFGGNTCYGAAGGATASSGGAATLATGFLGVAMTGNNGMSLMATSTASVYGSGGIGGSGPWGGCGTGSANSPGSAAIANSGSGGGGGGYVLSASLQYTGCGGSAGGYIKAIVASPSATYSYAVGANSAGGAAGTQGFAGAAGGSGQIIVTAYF